jgi:hypothetical protein
LKPVIELPIAIPPSIRFDIVGAHRGGKRMADLSTPWRPAGAVGMRARRMVDETGIEALRRNTACSRLLTWMAKDPRQFESKDVIL